MVTAGLIYIIALWLLGCTATLPEAMMAQPYESQAELIKRDWELQISDKIYHGCKFSGLALDCRW